MSVYARQTKDGPTWYFDFWIEGQRYTGRTHAKTERAALAAEARIRDEIRRRLERGEDPKAKAVTITLWDAADRWWKDIGQHRGDARDVRRRLDTCLRLIGETTPLEAIDTGTIIDAVQARRNEAAGNAARDAAGRYGAKRTVGAATANRDVIDIIRPVLRRARVVWRRQFKQAGVFLEDIDWGEAKLKEPKPIVKEEFSEMEAAAWVAQLTPTEALFLATLMRFGPRFGELFCAPSAVEETPTGVRLRIGAYKGKSGWKPWRKSGGEHLIPLVDPYARPILALARRAQVAGLETIWFDEDPSTGALYEIGYHAMYARLRGAARRAGIKGARLIHGTRHHAGTVILRSSGNLILAQKLLGHANIATTQRYAHAQEGDIRAALEAQSRQIPDARFLQEPKTHGAQGE